MNNWNERHSFPEAIAKTKAFIVMLWYKHEITSNLIVSSKNKLQAIRDSLNSYVRFPYYFVYFFNDRCKSIPYYIILLFPLYYC